MSGSRAKIVNIIISRYLLICILFIGLYSCSESSDNSKITQQARNKIGERQFGVYIKSGYRQGYQYFDSNKNEYNYRNYTILITNDTLVPIHFEIYFCDTGMIQNSRSKVFLLPRHLTPDEPRLEPRMSKELKTFLDQEIDIPVHLNKTMKPAEKCVLKLGILTSIKYPDPTNPLGAKLLISEFSQPEETVSLKINDSLIVPCGRVNYLPEK